ncbi:flagellar hook-associated protein 3 [Arthrobacter sulfonylureivorans]|uniref:Flagellin n=2 Tax=Arthrobacter sulfonylureivorans TaxID=2486855 RepID=A0ABY3W9W8_9MICC|nr:flagellar hook-associated protein 3 [Arthrobacter sulfonylureivorans]
MSSFAQRNLQDNMARIAKLQELAAGESLITRPSDDPTGTADSMRTRADIRANEQYKRNIDDANGWLTTADSALGTVTGLLNKARDLTIQASNGSLTPTAREAIALELDSIKSSLLDASKTQYLGRSVFAGNSDGKVFDYTDVAPYKFDGPDSTVDRRIGANLTVRVDADGASVFGEDGTDVNGNPTTSVFALLESMSADLRSGVDVSDRLNAIDAKLNTVINARAEVGTRHAQILKAQETNLDEAVSLEARRSGIEDPDLGKVVLDLKMQEVAYQAALQVTARVLQPTLMDFLR